LSWGPKYLLPAEKWWPLYWPNETWEVVPFTGPPAGAIGPWWKILPKDQWPIAAPWEPKVFGAWPASQISMMEDLQNHPPFGVIKVKTPLQLRGPQQASFINIKMHMRPDFGPIHHLRIRTHNTPMGQKFYLINQNWEQAEYDAQQYRKALKQMKMVSYMEQLAWEVAAHAIGETRPPKDLFA
jgi:hypothetical protein